MAALVALRVNPCLREFFFSRLHVRIIFASFAYLRSSCDYASHLSANARMHECFACSCLAAASCQTGYDSAACLHLSQNRPPSQSCDSENLQQCRLPTSSDPFESIDAVRSTQDPHNMPEPGTSSVVCRCRPFTRNNHQVMPVMQGCLTHM